MTGRRWFRTRANGLGWTPVTWEGWLITLGSAAIAVALNAAAVTHLIASAHR